MTLLPKSAVVRDRRYLDWLHDQPCMISGQRGSDQETIDPAHVGTLGKGIRSSDDEALPILHRYHAEGHQKGEISMWRKHAPDWLIREALRAYARQLYAEWKRTHERAA